MTIDPQAQAVIDYWTGIGPQGWYAGGDALDAEIRTEFHELWTRAADHELASWVSTPLGSLALILLTDQFPRNMFRGSGQAFATDAYARQIATRAYQKGQDLRIEGDLRQFFYLPFMHSETLVDQDKGVQLFIARMPGTSNLLHARAHREVIRRYGRFPYRNDALGRITTQDEAKFIENGGYGAMVETLRD